MTPYYEHAGITIYHGDCREIMPHVGKVDAVVTDPPYGEVNRTNSGLRDLSKGVADVVHFDMKSVLHYVCKTDATSVYVFCGIEQIGIVRKSLKDDGYSTRLCVWEKTNPSPMNGQHMWLSSLESCVYARKSGAVFNEFCASPVFKFPSGSSSIHPTQKPLQLIKKLMLVSSDENQTILDPFMGSGTTLVAAKQLGRKAIGIEISRKYCDIAIKRLSQEVLPFPDSVDTIKEREVISNPSMFDPMTLIANSKKVA